MNDIDRRVAETCEWGFDDGDCAYETDCGYVIQFTDGMLADDTLFKFCPYCGNAIIAINTTPADAGEVGE